MVLNGTAVLAGVAASTPADYKDFLQISEINYNPSDPTAAETAAGVTNNDDFEFIELYNSSSSVSLDLNNVQFTSGITFNFTGSNVTSLGPKDYLLLVKDQNAFDVRYGTGHNSIIAGQYSGSLSNTGENLVLVNPSGGDIQNFSYNDSHPWPLAADGYGFSLNLINPGSDPNHAKAKNWTSNGPNGGSPGAANVPTQPEIVINEILSHTDPPQVDQIELFNPTGSSVNLSGWFVSDDVATPQKFKLPNGSVVPANGYLVLFEDNDGDPTTPAPSDFFGSAFSLSSVGEDLYLQAGDGTDLTGFGTSVRFGAQFNGVAHGRFPNGTGDFFPMMINTFGAANSDPRVGPVVISEIMYNPPTQPSGAFSDFLEFVEIVNPTDEIVDLGHWQLNGIGYDFPEGTSIKPGQVRVLVPFDPINDTASITAFNTAYGVDIGQSPNIYLGPYSGKLSNAGEKLTLFHADQPPALKPDVYPLVLEDQVRYNDKSPWPTSPDGGGDSLARTALDAFGNFSSSWVGTAPTPGASQFFVLGDLNHDADVDFDDIADFVLGINDPVAYKALHGFGPVVTGDTNQDGDFDFDDIPGFVALLGGQNAAAASAEPVARTDGSSDQVQEPVDVGIGSQAAWAASARRDQLRQTDEAPDRPEDPASGQPATHARHIAERLGHRHRRDRTDGEPGDVAHRRAEHPWARRHARPLGPEARVEAAVWSEPTDWLAAVGRHVRPGPFGRGA